MTALKFPGPCPIMPLSHIVDPKDQAIEIVRSVPFSADTPTYLFVDMNVTLISSYSLRTEIEEENTIKITLNSVSLNPPFNQMLESRVIGDGAQKSNASIYLNSTIVEFGEDGIKPSQCHTPITETIRIWYEREFGIIYSCVEDHQDSTQHDEAVILVAFPPKDQISFFRYFHVPIQYSNMLMKLKNVADKYLPDRLISVIDWEEIPFDHYVAGDFDMYPCPIVN